MWALNLLDKLVVIEIYVYYVLLYIEAQNLETAKTKKKRQEPQKI